MDKRTVFIKTAKGESEGANLSSELKRILSLVDSKSTVDELAKRAPPSLREGCRDILGELEQEGYISDKNKPHYEPKIAVPKFNPLKMFSSKSTEKRTVYIKTAKGESEEASLSSDLKRVLLLVDNQTPADELAKSVPPSLRERWNDIIGELVAGEYIRDKSLGQIEAKIASSKSTPLKMFTPEPSMELDFHTPSAVPAPNAAELAARQKAEEAAQLEAAVEAAKARANAEAAAKAEAQAKQDAEILARGKALAEVDAAAKAEVKAKKEAEIAARAKAVAEANEKREAELRAQAAAKAAAKAKQEAAARMQAEQEAARNKAALDAALKVRAEIEAAARAQQVAEAKAKQEAAARMQAQEEAARAKAALEVAAREKAEAEARIRAEVELAARVKKEAEEKARKEAEAARLKVEQEAARVKAELAAAAKAKQEAEAALQKAEQEAARIRAEMAAAQARAEADAKAQAEARAKQEAEDKARREAETARLKAEHEAALVKAEQEALARVRAEAEVRAKQEAEERAKREAETARLKAEHEAALIRAEQEAVAKVRAEAEARFREEAEAKLRAEAELKRRLAAEANLQPEVEAKLRAEAEARAVEEALARQLQAEATARIEAEELAKRAAAIAEQQALIRSTQNIAGSSKATPAFQIQLDDFLGGEQPAIQNVEPVIHQPEVSDAAELLNADVAKAELETNSLANVAVEMARLKEESEAARRKVEEDARRKEEEQALAEEQAKAWAEAEQRAKTQAIIETEQAAQQTAMSQARAQQKPVARSHRKPLPLGKIAFALILLALIVAVVLPYVYPLNEYIAPLEQRLTAQLKQPVHIGSMSASSLPPKLQLQSVTVGNAKEVKIGSVALNFDLLTLFSNVKVVSNADLQDVSIQGDQIEKQVASLKLLGANTQYPLQHLNIERLKIVTDEVALPSLSGIADIDGQGVFNRLSLHSDDDKLAVDLQANQGRWQVGLNLKESSLFFLPDVAFSDLSAKGDLSDGEINFTELDAHLYNGILLGSAKINWRKGWQVQGHFEAKTFDLDKMFPKFHIEGELYGEGSFSLAGAKLSQLDDAPHMDGSFSIKKGTVSGFDMVETARLMSRENMVGGRTHFDDLIGLVQLDNHVAHFRQMKILSGMLSASGMFDVSAGNQIAGNFNAEIKMRPGNNTMTLFGTLAEPKLRAGN